MTGIAPLAGRRLWIGIPGPELDVATRDHLETVRPGGIVLFRRNVTSQEQVRHLCADLQELLGPELLVSADHEGGLVTRFHRELTVFPGNMALGAAGFREPSMGEHLAEAQGEQTSRELRDLGIHVNLAPVLDLASTHENPGVTLRSFGAPPELCALLGMAMVRGIRRGGVHPTLKHFPGPGDATVDSHLDLPHIPAGDHDSHLLPFRRCVDAGASLVMTSHAIYEALDGELPATLSAAITTDLLRGELGFEGVTLTDDLEMGAMGERFNFDDVVRGASAAGHDVFCIAHSADLQRRAGELLSAGLSAGASWFGDPTAIMARLDGLRALPVTAPPDPVVATQVAEAIAGRAITVLRDEKGLIPLPDPGRCVLALPTLRGETMVENPLRGEEDGSIFETSLPGVEIVRLGWEPTSSEVDALLERATTADRLLAVTTNARFIDAQRRYVERVCAHPGALVLPVRSPFDADVVPEDVTVVLSYGFRPGQLQALARVLRGEVMAYGHCPA